jgi:cytochrome c peroxidase
MRTYGFPALIATTLLGLLGCGSGSAPAVPAAVATQAEVGRALFFDENLSQPAGQSCASCHAPEKAFTDPSGGPTSAGVVPGLFGARNAPTAGYALFAPKFHYDEVEGLYVGGLFLDGRADSLAQQAQGPPLNPIEMHNPDKASYVAKVAGRPYAEKLKALHGQDLFFDVDRAFTAISEAIAAFERGAEVSPFTSKYDAYLRGTALLTAQERRGLDLYEGRANCAACHPNALREDGKLPLFTDFTYDNLGVPRNPANPFYSMPLSVNPAGTSFVDIGLAGNASVIADGRAAENRGRIKVPTLRNLARTGPYMHNGVFTTLKEVVAFYNRRDLEPLRFGPPEIPETVNREELGNLGLSDEEEDALVAFLKTLTDGYPAP